MQSYKKKENVLGYKMQIHVKQEDVALIELKMEK